jgi:hypothetical protein
MPSSGSRAGNIERDFDMTELSSRETYHGDSFSVAEYFCLLDAKALVVR